VRVVELDAPGVLEDPSGAFRLQCSPTPHTAESVAYRLSGSWGSVGYTGDTGPSEAVADFLDGCDALIAECTLPDDMAVETHLSPRSLAALAGRARPELLLVVHVTPHHSPTDAVRAISERYEGRILAGVDGLRVGLGPGGPAVDPSRGGVVDFGPFHGE
jgi:ribonuclease BN (tRNA processing enzyme)